MVTHFVDLCLLVASSKLSEEYSSFFPHSVSFLPFFVRDRGFCYGIVRRLWKAKIDEEDGVTRASRGMSGDKATLNQ
jgi:hypothetical protein